MTKPIDLEPAGLFYRPFEYDDWGMIRNADGSMFASVRRPLSEEEAAAHRAAKTDPFEDLAHRLIASFETAVRSAPEAGKAVVKPLEWQDTDFAGQVKVLGLTYSMQNGRDGWFVSVAGDYLPGDFETREEAKAAAQADYEQRILSALASPAPSGTEPVPKDMRQIIFDALDLSEELRIECTADVVNALAAAGVSLSFPQAVAPAEEIAGLIERLKQFRSFDIGIKGKRLIDEAAAALTASEAEASDLRRKMEETESTLASRSAILDDIALALECRGYVHMANGRDIGKLVESLEAAERKLEEHRKALEPFGRNAGASSLAKVYAHLTREHAQTARALTTDGGANG